MVAGEKPTAASSGRRHAQGLKEWVKCHWSDRLNFGFWIQILPIHTSPPIPGFLLLRSSEVSAPKVAGVQETREQVRARGPDNPKSKIQNLKSTRPHVPSFILIKPTCHGMTSL